MGPCGRGPGRSKAISRATQWKQRPSACGRWDKTGETVSIIYSATGETRAKVVTTAPGNAEKPRPSSADKKHRPAWCASHRAGDRQ